MKKDYSELTKAYEAEPMPYVAIMGTFRNLLYFAKEILIRICKDNDLDPEEYIPMINKDNHNVISDAEYVVAHHKKKKVRKAMDEQVMTYAGGIFHESREFMKKMRETGNEHIAEELLDVFQKNKSHMSAEDVFDIMKEIKDAVEDEDVEKMIDKDFKTIWPDTDVKN